MKILMPERPYEPPFEQVDLKHAFSILSNVPPMWTPYEVANIELPDFVPEEQAEERVKLQGTFREKPATLADS